MTTAIGYIRVSTEEQATRGASLGAQREAIEAYCKLRNLELLRVVSHEGVSGTVPIHKRPGWEEPPPASAVVAVKLDRLFRSATDALDATRRWNEHGITLHLVDLGGSSVDTSSAMGRFLLTVLAGAAEMERNLIAERTSAALQSRKAAGRRHTNHAPYGWMWDQHGKLVVHPYEMQVAKLVLSWIQEGKTWRKACDLLEQRDLTTRGGKPWSPGALFKAVRGATERPSPAPP